MVVVVLTVRLGVSRSIVCPALHSLCPEVPAVSSTRPIRRGPYDSSAGGFHPAGDSLGTVELRYQVGSRPRYASDFYSRDHNSLPALVALGDYFDYYWSEGAALELGYRIKGASLGLTVRDALLRPNSPIAEGRLRSLEGRLAAGPGFPPMTVSVILLLSAIPTA